MPSRGSYQISNIEEGKAAQREQSFRSCVLTLLIFLFLCIILILATLPWKSYNYYQPEHKDQQVESAQHHHHHTERTSTVTSTSEKHSKELEITSEINIYSENVDVIKTNSPVNSNTSSVSEAFRKEETTTEVVSTTNKQLYASISTTEEYQIKSITGESTSGTTDFTELVERNENITDGNITGVINSMRLNDSVAEEHKKDFANGSTTEAFTEFNETDTIEYKEDTSIIGESTVGTTDFTELVERDENMTEVIDSMRLNTSVVEEHKRESVNGSTTEAFTEFNETDTIEYKEDITDTSIVDESTLGTTDFTELVERDEIMTEVIDSMRLNKSIMMEHKRESVNGSTTEGFTKLNETGTIGYGEDITKAFNYTEFLSTSTNPIECNVRDEPSNEMNEDIAVTEFEHLQKSTANPNLEFDLTDSANSDLSNDEVCNTGECKNHASKMLFHMNHTIDPCEDFYEYTCGGFEANPKTVEQDLEEVAHQRILHQMQNEENTEHSPFANYYQSCIRYEDINQTERIQLVRGVLSRIGKFYTDASSKVPENDTSITELIANLLSYNSALLFDVAPDLNEYDPKFFTLRIGPTIYNSPFNADSGDDPCYDASRFKREDRTVNLKTLYADYKTCKNDTRRFINSVKEALTALSIFDDIQMRDLTIHFIDLCIMKEFYQVLPTKNEIREAYLMKNYTIHSIKELERDFKLVNWTHLIYYTTNQNIVPEAKVQVYFYDVLAKGLKNLEEHRQMPGKAILLHNALLGLYAYDLYHQFVLSKYQDIRKYCLRVAAKVLIAEASNLYISSFSEDQLAYMDKTIHDLFEDLKTSLKQKIDIIKWATEEQRRELITKVNDLKIVTPNVSYFTDTESTYRRCKANEVDLKNNYLENSVILMQRYRELMYAEFYLDPGSPEHVWTHYATPYQSKGLAIYGLNLVVIPYGAIDWSIKYNEPQFDYIRLATLGNVIAHQIAYHFDANGIHYWNGTRDANNTLLSNNSTNTIFDEYISIQRNYLYPDLMNTTLASTGQTVLYEIPQLTLNERLSEIMGVRLAYDTLDRLRSPKEIILPWLQLNVNQLFYLTYAQMHCTKSPLTSSYISLYENEQLPSRIRIFVTASNTRLIGEAWKCLEGSRIMPSFISNAFPYLD